MVDDVVKVRSLKVCHGRAPLNILTESERIFRVDFSHFFFGNWNRKLKKKNNKKKIVYYYIELNVVIHFQN